MNHEPSVYPPSSGGELYAAPNASGDAQPYETAASPRQSPPPPNLPPWMQRDESPLSVGSCLITILVACIPVVGLVLLFVWGFDSRTNLNKRNLCRALLLFFALLYGGFLFLHLAMLPAVMQEMFYYY